MPDSKSNSTPTFNAMQHGRALFIWINRNLVSELESRDVDLTDVENVIQKNPVLSARQAYIRTMNADTRIEMESQGVETYFRNTHNEFFGEDDDGVIGGNAKVVTLEEVEAVGDLVVETIELAMVAYETKLEGQVAKDADVAARKEQRELDVAARKTKKAEKEKVAAAKKVDRENARQEKLVAKEAAKTLKAEEKAAAILAAKEFREDTLALMQGGSTGSSDTSSDEG